MSEIEIKDHTAKCPSCGATKGLYTDFEWDDVVFFCDNCKVVIKYEYIDTAEELEQEIEAWNTRCERTSAVEWRVVNEQEEIVCGYCRCGKWLDICHTWEAPRLPRYCSDCGAKVVDDGD